MYRLDTGLVQNAPNASFSPELWMLSSCRRLVDCCLMLCHIQCNHSQTWNEQSHSTASRVCPCPLPIWSERPLEWGWVSLHCVFSTLMCSLNEKCESHHSPRNFVDSSTGRSVSNPHKGGSLSPRPWLRSTNLHFVIDSIFDETLTSNFQG